MATRPALPRRVAIVGGNRIPFARAGREYAHASNQDMLTAALNGLARRHGLTGEPVGAVVAGAVLKHSRDYNLTREAVLGSVLASTTPAYDLQQACDTGLQAVAAVADKIALGHLELGIAGGADSASDVPVAVSEGLRRVLLEANRARSSSSRLRALRRLRPRHLAPAVPRNEEPRTGLSMGDSAALTAVEWGIGRAEQDELAVRSHRRLAAAYERGLFDDLLTPYLGLERDSTLRPDSTVERLAGLPTVFGSGASATMTAANSTPLTDGASAVLLCSEAEAQRRGWEPLAFLVAHETAAVDYVHGAEGLLMAPAYAMPRMLDRAGLGLQDFDLYEIHEAFASQVLATLRAWEDPIFCKQRLRRATPLGAVDTDRLNVAGSSLATGHPFAATGGRIVATLAALLAERGSGRGVVSICAAGGQGMTAILER